jgi:hypothetical protein
MPQPFSNKLAAAIAAVGGGEEVIWHPLGMIPVIADLIDGMVDESTTQIGLFTEALGKPHVMDDAIIDRALRLYGERVHFIEIDCEQLRRWRNENPDARQRREIDRLETQISRLRQMNAHILSLAAEIRKGTINRILEKDDAELGLEFLLALMGADKAQ